MDVLDHHDKRREPGSALDDPPEQIARPEADQHAVKSRQGAGWRVVTQQVEKKAEISIGAERERPKALVQLG